MREVRGAGSSSGRCRSFEGQSSAQSKAPSTNVDSSVGRREPRDLGNAGNGNGIPTLEEEQYHARNEQDHARDWNFQFQPGQTLPLFDLNAQPDLEEGKIPSFLSPCDISLNLSSRNISDQQVSHKPRLLTIYTSSQNMASLTIAPLSRAPMQILFSMQ